MKLELDAILFDFDGTLAPDRRHGRGADPAEVTRIVERWRDAGAVGFDAVRHVGEARLNAWLERPPSRIPRDAAMRDSYDEADLFAAIVTVR